MFHLASVELVPESIGRVNDALGVGRNIALLDSSGCQVESVPLAE